MNVLNTSTATQALDALESSLRVVLLQTGSALSNATGADGAKLSSIRSHVDRSLPEALNRWHNALNGLSAQLTDAKAALHRDLAVSRSQTATQANHMSPASSDSDTVMVEAPSAQANTTQPNETSSNDIKSEAQPQSQAETGQKPVEDASQDTTEEKAKVNVENVDKLESSQPGNESENPSQLLSNIQSNTSSSNNKPSPSLGLNLELTSTPQNLNSRSASPLPSIERPAASTSNLEDPGNELANTDISAMLPGLMDYATDFPDGPVTVDPFGDTGQSGGMNMDGGDSTIDDLFGEGTAGMDEDLFGADTNINFDGFSFDNLAAQEDMQTGDDAANAAFDHSLFTDEFFNLDGGN